MCRARSSPLGEDIVPPECEGRTVRLGWSIRPSPNGQEIVRAHSITFSRCDRFSPFIELLDLLLVVRDHALLATKVPVLVGHPDRLAQHDAVHRFATADAIVGRPTRAIAGGARPIHPRECVRAPEARCGPAEDHKTTSNGFARFIRNDTNTDP